MLVSWQETTILAVEPPESGWQQCTHHFKLISVPASEGENGLSCLTAAAAAWCMPGIA